MFVAAIDNVFIERGLAELRIFVPGVDARGMLDAGAQYSSQWGAVVRSAYGRR